MINVRLHQYAFLSLVVEAIRVLPSTQTVVLTVSSRPSDKCQKLPVVTQPDQLSLQTGPASRSPLHPAHVARVRHIVHR